MNLASSVNLTITNSLNSTITNKVYGVIIVQTTEYDIATQEELNDGLATKVNTSVSHTNPMGGVNAWKQGNVVTVYINLSQRKQTTSTNVNLCTLPEGYRPKSYIAQSYSRTSSDWHQINIATTGLIRLACTTSPVDVSMAFTYIV